MENDGSKLNVCRFALAVGITCSLGIFLLGLVSTLTGGFGDRAIEMVSSIYIGFQATFVGSFIGALWGLVDGTVMGFLLSSIYNLLGNCCCPTKSCAPKS